MAEAQRLRDLHFKVSAPDTKVVDGAGNPQLVIHKTPNDFTVFDNSRSIGNLNWAATPKAFEGENGVYATGAGTNPKEMRLYVNMKNPHYPTIDEGMEPAFIEEGEDGILGIADKNMTDLYKSASDAGEGFHMSLGVDNPYALKSENAVTYDNNGVRIPLGMRDNFKINDIRYGLLPFLGLGTASTLYMSSGNENAYGGNLYPYGGTKKQAFLTSLDQSLKEDSRFDSAEWRQFFTDLADKESGYSSNITNSIGAKGYFQLMPFNRAKAWKNPTQQFHEMYKLTGNNLNYLNKNLTKEDWKRAEALGIDMYGMLAGAHLGGAGNVLKALRGKGNAKDMNGSSVMGYMTRFSQRGKTPTLAIPSYVEESMPLFTPSNPEVFFGGYKAPEIEAPLPSVELEDTPQYSEEEIARQERRERLNNLSMLMNLTSPQGSSNSMLDALGLLMR